MDTVVAYFNWYSPKDTNALLEFVSLLDPRGISDRKIVGDKYVHGQVIKYSSMATKLTVKKSDFEKIDNFCT